MPKLLFLITMTLMFSISSLGQTETQDIYPEVYSLETAKHFVQLEEYQEAIWFCINLYPKQETEAVSLAKEIHHKLDTTDFDLFVKMAFARFSIGDPEVSSMDDGVLGLNMEMLGLKGSWGDNLIKSVLGLSGKLSATEYNMRGLRKFNAGNYDDAVLDFDSALLMEKTGQFYFNRGFAKSMLDDYVGAIQDYNSCIMHDHRENEARYERGYCKYQSGQYTAAIEDFDLAISNDSKYADAYRYRGMSKAKLNEHKEAINDYSMAIKYDAIFDALYVLRGESQMALGKSKAACKDWQKAAAMGNTGAAYLVRKNCR